ncbi:hypothetical protein RB653_008731 [Dictyostelium firmibasis]|uniref:PNT domain-containing protein n=1 Tax=Dictyostelium firmibasis TaxID=79012 RepID=A0AAN7U0K6_9MYCE
MNYSFKKKDLKDWSIEDTKEWINEFKKRGTNLENVDFSRFEWDGEQLSLFSMADFQRMSPYGIPLYRNLYSQPKIFETLNKKKSLQFKKSGSHEIQSSSVGSSYLDNINMGDLDLNNDIIENEIVNRTVLIRVGTIHTFITFGAGCRIGKNLILVSKHVVQHSSFPQDKIIFNVGVVIPSRWVSAKLIDVSQDDQTDLALLEIIDNDSTHHVNSQNSDNSGSSGKESIKSSSSNIVGGDEYDEDKYKNQKQQHDEKNNEASGSGGDGNNNDENMNKNHTVNSSEFTSPSFDYHHLDELEKEREKQDFEIICNTDPIEFIDQNDGLLGKDIILCGFPKERIDISLCQEQKIKVETVYPSIEKGTVSFSDDKRLECNSVPEPGYSESSLIFSKSNAKFIGLVKSQYMTNPNKYYCIPTSTILKWISQVSKKNSINISF